jgi:hypothetical protein
MGRAQAELINRSRHIGTNPLSVNASAVMLTESTTISEIFMDVIPVSGALFDPFPTRRLSCNCAIFDTVGTNRKVDKTTLQIARNVKNAG